MSLAVEKPPEGRVASRGGAAARGAAWLAATVAAASLLAWGAVTVQRWFAPLLLLPILLGMALGLIGGRLAATLRLSRPAAIAATAGLIGILLVPAMHIVGWLEYRATYSARQPGRNAQLTAAILSNPELAPLAGHDLVPPPDDFPTYVRRQAQGRDWFGGRRSGAVVWWSWGLDALLAATATAVAAFVTCKQRSS